MNQRKYIQRVKVNFGHHIYLYADVTQYFAQYWSSSAILLLIKCDSGQPIAITKNVTVRFDIMKFHKVHLNFDQLSL